MNRATCLIAVLLGFHGRLSAAPEGGDEPIPTALKPGRYEALWENSPFLRPLNAAESYVLTSVAHIDGKPLVTVLNTSTNERFMLTPEINRQGWRLLDLRTDPNPRNVMARISVNGEEMAVRFNDEQLAANALLKAADGTGRVQPSPTPRSPGSTLGAKRAPVQDAEPAQKPSKRPKKQQRQAHP